MKYLLPVLFLALVGCASQTVYIQGDLTGPPDHEETQTFWLYGIGQETTIDATPICGSKHGKLTQVRTRQTFTNVLLTMLTLGVYAPRTIQISCR